MSPRIRIFELLGIIFFVALGLTALRFGSPLSVTAMAWLILFWLSVALLGALYGRGRSRVYWTGFAIFGWIYMLLIHNSLISTTLASEMGSGLRRLVEDSWVFNPSPPGNALQRADMAQLKIRVRVLSDLCLNLAFAFTGGMTALWFAARNEPEPGPARGPSPVSGAEP
jgi:hypothetical protein